MPEVYFRRAIAQSGAANHVDSSTTARRVGQYLAQQLGMEPTLKAITAVPIDRLIHAQREWSIGAVARRYSEVVASRQEGQAQGNAGPDAGGSPERLRWDEVSADVMPFEPVVDGQILARPPIESIAAGAGGEVDVLVGTNADEYRLFLIPTGLINFITDDFLAAAIAACGLPVPETLTTYRGTRPAASPGELLVAVLTDWIYRLPAVRLAEAHTPGSGRTYMYEFAWKSPQFAGQLGACHMAELPFVFDNLDKRCLERLVGPNPPQPLAEAMHSAWVAFATRWGSRLASEARMAIHCVPAALAVPQGPAGRQLDTLRSSPIGCGSVALTQPQLGQAGLIPRRTALPAPRSSFTGFRFPPEVIRLAVRWYLCYSLSYRDVEDSLPRSASPFRSRSTGGCSGSPPS